MWRKRKRERKRAIDRGRFRDAKEGGVGGVRSDVTYAKEGRNHRKRRFGKNM